MTQLPESFLAAIKEDRLDDVRAMLERKEVTAADMNAPAPDFAHHALVQTRKLAMVKLLVEYGADVNNPLPGKVRNSPVMSAFTLEYYDIAEYLLTLPLDLKYINAKGMSALYIACGSGRPDLIAPLLAQGVDVSAKTTEGHTPFNRIVHPGTDVSAVALLLSKIPRDARGEVELLNVILSSDDAAAAQRVLDSGSRVNLNEFTAELAPPLHVAVLADARAIATLLLDRGADVNLPFEGYTKCTPLMYATSAEMVNLLVERGANINALDAYGNTPLSNAAFFLTNEARKLAVCTAHILAGADPEQKTISGGKIDLPKGCLAAVETARAGGKPAVTSEPAAAAAPPASDPSPVMAVAAAPALSETEQLRAIVTQQGELIKLLFARVEALEAKVNK